MKRYDMWDAFAKTGRIEDYLRYRGVDVYDRQELQGIQTREDRHRHDDRRIDHQGEQQYW